MTEDEFLIIHSYPQLLEKYNSLLEENKKLKEANKKMYQDMHEEILPI